MATATNFLSKDGLLNVEAFVALAREIDKVATKEGLKPTDIYFVGKVIPKYDAAKAKADPEMFLKKRAQVVKTKTRMPSAGSRVKMVVMLRDYKELAEAHPEFDRDFEAAVKAIGVHNKLAEKTIASQKASGAKKREAATKEFDKNVDAFLDLMEQAGVSEKNVAIGTSMMGKTIIVKLPNGGYVSVGKADAERFNKAKAGPSPSAVGAKKAAPAAAKPARGTRASSSTKTAAPAKSSSREGRTSTRGTKTSAAAAATSKKPVAKKAAAPAKTARTSRR